VAAIAPDLRWDFPLRLLGGLHYLVLGGEASWDDVDEVLETRADWLARFAAEQPVQTNEIGRAAAVARGLAALRRDRIDLRRRGIDRNPIDVTTDEGARLLEAFVWHDQSERIERLRAAIEVVRREPPELIQGDYVDVLEEHVHGQTLVMSCVTTMYLDDDRYSELVEKLRGVDWLSLEGPRHDRQYEGMQLVLNGRVLEEHVDYHG
jgi:hypothetical protein